VFRIPYQYQGQPSTQKLFVLICHEKLFAVCFKATSQTTLYDNNKEMRSGVVYYKAGELSYFSMNTAIQPDNAHPIPHAHIAQCHANASLKLLGQMPTDFHDKLVAAVKASITLSEDRKQSILSRI
jgi:hypothetical protein